MNLREVTIGRSNDCDIFLDPRCRYASSHHATLYYDGNQLMYRDTSTNGTMVNNISVHHRAVPIHPGDVIMLAGQYPLTWNQILEFFPYQAQQPGPRPPQPQPQPHPQQPVYDEEPDLSKWCWGAFSLSWLWGFFNGCWWMFLVNLGIGILYALGLVVPGLSIVAGIIALVVAIYFGSKGTEWAWNNRQWNSVADFQQTQKGWNIAGGIVFIINILVVIGSILTVGVALASLL